VPTTVITCVQPAALILQVRVIERRRNLDDIHADEIASGEPAQDSEQLARRQIQAIDIDRHVQG
jgi:hypothetical protein